MGINDKLIGGAGGSLTSLDPDSYRSYRREHAAMHLAGRSALSVNASRLGIGFPKNISYRESCSSL